MKNIKLHAIILALIIVSELIGTHTLKFGIGRIVLLPMLYALLLGILTTPKFLNLSGRKEMLDASSLVGVTLMLLMARYGILIWFWTMCMPGKLPEIPWLLQRRSGLG